MCSIPKRREFCAIGLMATLLLGCPPQVCWTKAGAQEGDFERDVAECRRLPASQEADNPLRPFPLKRTLGVPHTVIEQCLAEEGWFLAEKPD